jgi:hypothetical protein
MRSESACPRCAGRPAAAVVRLALPALPAADEPHPELTHPGRVTAMPGRMGTVVHNARRPPAGGGGSPGSRGLTAGPAGRAATTTAQLLPDLLGPAAPPFDLRFRGPSGESGIPADLARVRRGFGTAAGRRPRRWRGAAAGTASALPIAAGALRVRTLIDAPGASPAALHPAGPWRTGAALARVLSGRPGR